eukprot:g37410.t1
MPAVDGSGSVTGPALALALAAGSLGALASTAAKLSLGAGNDLGLVDQGKAEWLHMLLQVGCGGMAFLFNALMWTLFAKALRYSSSARVSVTTIASNFLSSNETRSAIMEDDSCLAIRAEGDGFLINYPLSTAINDPNSFSVT